MHRLINACARFHDIAWSQTSDSNTRGVIAGALEDGSLDLWDADKLIGGNGQGLYNVNWVQCTNMSQGSPDHPYFQPCRCN